MPSANQSRSSRSTSSSKKSAATKASKKKTSAKKAATKRAATKKSTAKKPPAAERTSGETDSSSSEPVGDKPSGGGPFAGFDAFGNDSAPWGIPFGNLGQPPDFGDVGEFIRNQRELAKLSVRRLAELANVSNPYLSQVERGLRKPSADILQQLASALRISVESLYVKAGILPDDPDRAVSSVAEAIEHDPYLSDEQKVALRGVYDSFVGPSS